MRHPNVKRLLRSGLQSAVALLALPVLLLACTSCTGAAPGATHLPAGPIHEFPLPTAGSSPSGITEGPDGTPWFVEYNGNRIGHILV
jgi:hypothetical protein